MLCLQKPIQYVVWTYYEGITDITDSGFKKKLFKGAKLWQYKFFFWGERQFFFTKSWKQMYE